MKTYDNIAAQVFDRPWLLQPSVLGIVAEVAGRRIRGVPFEAAEIDDRVAEARMAAGPRNGSRVAGAVGVIAVYGPIMPRANIMTQMSGGTTVSSIREQFRQAMADESVGSILFEFDSPGGAVDQVPELAAEIRAARGQKPIAAIANTLCASAAYWWASAADEVYATPSAMVGSIGVYMAHTEYSVQDTNEGVTTTIIRQPPGKIGANEWEPLSAEAKTELQDLVDGTYADFVAAIAAGRGISVAQVKADYGGGKVFSAAGAKKAGLVDQVLTFDQAISRLASGKVTMRPMGGRAAEGGLRWTYGGVDLDPLLPMEGVTAPSDGTLSVLISGDGSGQALPPIDAEAVDGVSPSADNDLELELARARARRRR